MMRARTLLASVLGFALSLPATATAADLDPKDVEFFETKVRPILVEHCYKCHAATSEKIRGGLLLDTKGGWEKGGDTGPAIVPGKPDESLLVEALRYGDPNLKMPPKGKLPDATIAVLSDWVKRGAPDPRAGASAAPKKKARTIDLVEEGKHWAYQPLTPVEPPAIKNANRSSNPIDRFIGAKLDAKGLVPNETASRRTLIRRLSLDLIGLPPLPEDVEAFVKDESPEAYGKLTDRLLASPRFGERWARHWLDLARWAESHGFEHDYDRATAYHYRDFVIEAFNSDLPFDTFAKWQIAGDELAPENPLALKATGFLAAGTHSTQITANQVEKERYDELDDMANITGTAFLGLTVGCARCHDHKFDPIPTRDYYRFVSIFTKTVRSEIDLNLDPEGYKKAVAKHEVEHAPYVAKLEAFERSELPSRFLAWEDARPAKSERPKWVVLDPSKMESKGGASFTKNPDGSVTVGGKNAEFDTYTITAACDLPSITGIKIEPLADKALVAGGPGRAGNGNFDLTDLKLTIGPRYGIGKTEQASLINPKASFEQPGLPITAAVDADKKSGWAVDPQFGKDHAAVFEIGGDVRPDGGATLVFALDFQGNTGHNFGKFRLSVTDAPRPVGLDGSGLPMNVAAILLKPRDRRTAEEGAAVLSWYKTIDPEWRALKIASEEHAKNAPKPNGVKALISTEGLPAVRLHTQGGDFLEKTHLLRRGDPNQKTEVVGPGYLQVLIRAPKKESHWKAAPPKGWRTSYQRVGLANWLTDTETGAGHLLARVVVNRLWQHHMGRGLVSTPSDFGKQGEMPTHPELLDWLASELIRSGWHLKPIHRLIVTSATYRESSRIDPAKQSIDPENLLCWRHPKTRLQAEAVRDSMLFVSGKLDERMYGPGSLDERMTRRSVYFTIKRSKLIPMMMLFDAPDALTGLATRSTTTVPPQSLMLMNSPIVRDWAESFAKGVSARAKGTEDSVRLAYAKSLGRAPDADELRDGVAFLKGQAEAHKANGKGDGTEAALADFCQVLMGLNEFIFVE
ncbi:MAG: Planctomycete cytochrome [Planctomycetota bacterium]|nr:Planctomycete cytochrome [Planctomycetota bacterium]